MYLILAHLVNEEIYNTGIRFRYRKHTVNELGDFVGSMRKYCCFAAFGLIIALKKIKQMKVVCNIKKQSSSWTTTLSLEHDRACLIHYHTNVCLLELLAGRTLYVQINNVV